jgi:GDP-L-fucose synthase
VKTDSRIFVAGAAGMVGAALVRRLRQEGHTGLLLPTRAELDLLDQAAVASFFAEKRPEYVFLAAGKTGGIYANNTYRADFLYENLVMQANVIHQSFLAEVRKLVFFACSCIYPRHCPQPMKEEHLLTGPLEPTNEPFAVAKIAGLKMCESYNRQYGTDFMTLIPTNLYGPGQHYQPMNALVVPSLMHRFHQAREKGEKSITIWGTGRPTRDFLYVDDLADASLFLIRNFEGNLLLNVGSGREVTIAQLAEVIRRETGFTGEVLFDPALPDGAPQKLQDLSRLHGLGWTHRVELEQGIAAACRDAFPPAGGKGGGR